MPLDQAYPELDELRAAIGEAGQCLSSLEASEGAAGNISVCIGWPREVRCRLPLVDSSALLRLAPALVDAAMIFSSSVGVC